MKFEISEWKGATKTLTITSGIITIATSGVNIFTNLYIPGLRSIALGTFMFGFGLKELNTFKESKEKYNLRLGIAFIVIFILNLYVGILDIQNYIFSLN